MYVMTETAFPQVINASTGVRTAPQTFAPALKLRSAVPSKLWVSDKRIEGIVSQRDAVGESVAAVEETSPAVEESVHGGLFLRPAAPQQIDAT